MFTEQEKQLIKNGLQMLISSYKDDLAICYEEGAFGPANRILKEQKEILELRDKINNV